MKNELKGKKGKGKRSVRNVLPWFKWEISILQLGVGWCQQKRRKKKPDLKHFGS